MGHIVKRSICGLVFSMIMTAGVVSYQPAQETSVAPVPVRYAIADAKSTESAQAEAEESLRNEIVEYAKQFVGNPYVYGGTSLTNGADCSGFTLSVYKNFGISLNRTSRDQANNGTTISVKNIKKGDLVFYAYGGRIGHVAMYIGDGKIVHASTERTGIKISNMNYNTPYKAVTMF